MNIKAELQQLYARHESDLGDYAWMNEGDRWAELIFCLLSQLTAQDPQAVRAAVASLQYLGLTQTDRLAALDPPGSECALVVSYILRQHGFPEDNARSAVGLLARVGEVIQREYGGKIQRFLRRQGEIMRDQLASAIGGDSWNPQQLRHAISRWLQNVLSLPVSLEHQAIVEFCNRNGVNIEEVLTAADELDLNIALLDDLLEFDRFGQADPDDQGPEGATS